MITLQVEVKTKADVITEEEFNQIYIYDEKVRYYKQRVKDLHYNEEDMDQLKLMTSYIAQIKKEDNDQYLLNSLKESRNLAISEENRRKVNNNISICRILYIDEPISSDEKVIKLFFNRFLNQDNDFYRYYQYAIDTDFQTFKNLFDIDLKAGEYIWLDEQDYQSKFSQRIIPTKDNIVAVQIQQKNIEVHVHIDTTKNTQVYNVSIPAVVTKADGNFDMIEYKYIVIMEKEKIKGIQYISQKPIIESSELEQTEDKEKID
jgi:hypothetical protein